MYRSTLTRTLAITICAAAMFGCSSNKGEAKKEGQVLAKVNDTTISSEEFKKEMGNLPPYLQPMTQTAEGKKELLDNMIVRAIILQEASKSGLDKSKEVTDKLDDLKKRIIVELYFKDKVEKESKVTDDEIKKFYDQNQEKFKTPTGVKKLEEVQEQIKNFLLQSKQQEVFQKMKAELKKNAKIEVKEDALKALGGAAAGGSPMPAGHPEVAGQQGAPAAPAAKK